MSATPEEEEEQLRSDLRRTRTELESRSHELARSLAVMQATLESTADAILVTSETGRIENFNQRFLDLWGLQRDAIADDDHAALARRVGHLFRNPEAVSARIESVHASAGESSDRLELADGRSFERFSRPQSVAGRTVGRVWSYRDITKADELERLVRTERAARAEVVRVSQLKDEFLATFSHELRTPMSAILGWAKALLLKRADAATLERGLDAISRNAIAQARLIDDLLDMNRIISGKVRLEVRPLDLASVIAAAIEVVRPSADAKGLRLQQVLDPLAGTVSGDPDRLQQVIWNLLTNAVKFTPRGGRIEVLLRRAESHLELTVRDDGIGIEAPFLAQVFDRFRQADASTPRSRGGLGLGLSIARQLVELHGGSIAAASDGLGAGASFVVRLPLQPTRAICSPSC